MATTSITNTAACVLELTGTVVENNATNKGGGNYKYSDLPHLQSIVLPVVKKHGLVLTQTVTSYDVRMEVTKIQKRHNEPPVDRLMTFAQCEVQTTLADPSNLADSISVVTYGAKVDQSSDKALGAFTVGKRYGLAALFNLILVDDDGADPDSDASDIRNQLATPFTTAPKPTNTSNILDNILNPPAL